MVYRESGTDLQTLFLTHLIFKMSGPHGLPLALLTDSYKISHKFLYPESRKMVAYGEFRAGYDKDKIDTRLVYYGIRYIIEHYVAIKYTEADVEMAASFFETHNVGATPFPFPKDLFIKVLSVNYGEINHNAHS